MWKCKIRKRKLFANYDSSVYGETEKDLFDCDVEQIIVMRGQSDANATRHIKEALRHDKRFRIIAEHNTGDVVLELERQ